jgi:hypothetical protein
MRLPGDTESVGILTAVGTALSAWEQMEGHLADLYAALLNSQTHGARIGYGYIQSSSVRLTLLTAALGAHPHKVVPPLVQVGDFLRRVAHFSERRNELAHGRLLHILGGGANGWFLVPAWYSSSKFPAFDPEKSAKVSGLMPAKYAYVADQIFTYATHITSLRDEAKEAVLTVGDSWGLEARQSYPRRAKPPAA